MADSEGFENVASIDDIPEEGVLAVTLAGGERVCLIRSQGRIFAAANNCTHQDFEMSLGDVLPDGTIQCAWHGARFDCETGAVAQGPATQPLPMYEVRINEGEILVGASPHSADSPQSAVAVSPQSAVSQQPVVSPESAAVGPQSEAVSPQSANPGASDER